MGKRIILITAILFLSCKKNENVAVEKENVVFDYLIFSVESIIIEQFSETPEVDNFHFVVKIENTTDNIIKMPLNGASFVEGDSNNVSFFTIKNKEHEYNCISYLLNDTIDTVYIHPNKNNYILLTQIRKNNSQINVIDDYILEYEIKEKSFSRKIAVKNSNTKIIRDEELDIEEAIKLTHGVINGVQY